MAVESSRSMSGRPHAYSVLLAVGVAAAAAWLWLHHRHAYQASPVPPPVEPVTPRSAPPVAAAATPASRVHVLAINGGGSAPQNYLSHLQHLQALVDLLHGAGVPAERITVLAGDGSDATPDLAMRVENAGREYWRLRGTPLEGEITPRIELATRRSPAPRSIRPPGARSRFGCSPSGNSYGLATR